MGVDQDQGNAAFVGVLNERRVEPASGPEAKPRGVLGKERRDGAAVACDAGPVEGGVQSIRFFQAAICCDEAGEIGALQRKAAAQL